MRTYRPALTILAVSASLTLTLFGCSSGAPTAAPTAAPPSSVATVGPAIITAAPTTTTSSSPIADGTYQSAPIDVAGAIARIKADKTLSSDDRTAFLEYFGGHQTLVVTLDLEAGQYTQSAGFDGAHPEVGSRATYAFPDASTLVLQEDCCGLSTLTITPRSNGFSLAYKAGAPNAAEDIGGEILLETQPFTLVPAR